MRLSRKLGVGPGATLGWGVREGSEVGPVTLQWVEAAAGQAAGLWLLCALRWVPSLSGPCCST